MLNTVPVLHRPPAGFDPYRDDPRPWPESSPAKKASPTPAPSSGSCSDKSPDGSSCKQQQDWWVKVLLCHLQACWCCAYFCFQSYIASIVSVWQWMFQAHICLEEGPPAQFIQFCCAAYTAAAVAAAAAWKTGASAVKAGWSMEASAKPPVADVEEERLPPSKTHRQRDLHHLLTSALILHQMTAHLVSSSSLGASFLPSICLCKKDLWAAVMCCSCMCCS